MRRDAGVGHCSAAAGNGAMRVPPGVFKHTQLQMSVKSAGYLTTALEPRALRFMQAALWVTRGQPVRCIQLLIGPADHRLSITTLAT